jgi:hypothetical protein
VRRLLRSAFETVPLLLFLGATGATGGCRTTSTSRVPGPESVTITRAEPVRAWEIWESGRCLGSLVRFAVPGDATQSFFSVLNREGQEIGLVDLSGRAWRHRPHESEMEWLGTGTVTEGTRRILGGTSAAELVDVDLGQLREVLEKLR